jgi:branched-chain amino acid transport system substrate-binding protein
MKHSVERPQGRRRKALPTLNILATIVPRLRWFRDEEDGMEERGEHPSRPEFLRRAGALGIGGAAVLGFPLLETRRANALLRPPAPAAIAAGGGVTVKLGYVDSFSGVYAAAGASQESGIRVAIAEAEKQNSRITFELVKGDDTGKPAVATGEAQRLINREKVGALMGGVSSAVGLALSAICQENGTFFLAIGTHDTNITGANANRVTFRTCPNNAMLANAVAAALLKHGRRWYFIVADDAFGTDAHGHLKKILLAHGGEEIGVDLHPLGQIDYSSSMMKARNTSADVMVFCNYGPDTQNSTKAFVALGLHREMNAGGILCGNDVAVGMPFDALVGSIWGVDWDPEAGGRSCWISSVLQPAAQGFPPNWRQYLGYIAAEQLIDRLNAAGSTNAEALVKAFEDHRFDAGKSAPAVWRKCDHQNVQETYAGMIVAEHKRRGQNEYFEIVNTVGGEFGAGLCSNPDSAKAAEIISSQKIPTTQRRAAERVAQRPAEAAIWRRAT